MAHTKYDTWQNIEQIKVYNFYLKLLSYGEYLETYKVK
jgi:hypothetical protein